MMKINPIQTVYHGYKFRSRLEARWAVFFDDMGIEYEYEVEGYSLKSGNYLPDFYIPSLDIIVEIKQNNDSITDRDINRWMELSDEKPLLLICGSPTKEYLMLFCKKNNDSIRELSEIGEKRNITNLYDLRFDLGMAVKFSMTYLGGYVLIMEDDVCSYWYECATIKAKQARFEFEDKAN